MGTADAELAGGALTDGRRPCLEISNLHAWYGESHVLHGVDLKVDEGEVVTLLGRNGAGRTSTLRAILGLIGSRTGSIKVSGVETIGMATHRIARLGLGYCPEERGIFASLSAEENLLLPPQLADGGMTRRRDLRDVPQPAGAPRPARARACRAASSRCSRWRASCAPGAKLLLLDEISEGPGAGDRPDARRARSARCASAASRSSWSSRISASRRRSRTAST